MKGRARKSRGVRGGGEDFGAPQSVFWAITGREALQRYRESLEKRYPKIARRGKFLRELTKTDRELRARKTGIEVYYRRFNLV